MKFHLMVSCIIGTFNYIVLRVSAYFSLNFAPNGPTRWFPHTGINTMTIM